MCGCRTRPGITAVYLGIVFGEAAAYHAAAMESRGDRYQPGVRVRLEAARFVLAEDYLRALRGRDVIRTDIDSILEGCDVLMAPYPAHRAAARRRSNRDDRRHGAPGTEPHAAVDAAVQHQRSPHRHDSRGPHVTGVLVRRSADRPPRRHYAAARSRARLRATWFRAAITPLRGPARSPYGRRGVPG